MSQGMHPASGFSPTGHPKMRATWLLTALLAAALPAVAAKPPNVQWTKNYMASSSGDSVVQTRDGGFVAVGATTPDDGGSSRYLRVATCSGRCSLIRLRSVLEALQTEATF